MAKGGFFARLFGIDNNDSTQENQNNSSISSSNSEPTESTLQDAVNFVAELQSYYYNDICKMQTDLLVQEALTKSEENFINKKIKQDQIALEQIDEILDSVQEAEREYQSIWKKSVYSFYDEIEDSKLATAQSDVFDILLRLCVVNTKPELENVILNRIEKYRQDWNIDAQKEIPKNYNLILVDMEDNIEEYRFGDFSKQAYAWENEKFLSASQLDKIRNLEILFKNEIQTDYVWVYSSSVTRLQLNFMRRTCIINNDWEYIPEGTDNLSFDIVPVEHLEQYLKGILQILLTRRTYAVISIVIPTNDMLSQIQPIEQKERRVEICKKYRFILRERSGLYKENLVTARIDRRNIPEKLQFLSYLEFKKLNF